MTRQDTSRETYFPPDNITNQKFCISCKQFVKSNHFNPIHVATKRELVGLLQQSIPFRVDLVYILVHFPKFSLINFVALNTEISSSLHTTILEKHKQTKHLIILNFCLGILFLVKRLGSSNPVQSILTLIVQTTVSAVLGTFSKQQQGALKVSLWSIFCY